MVVNIEQLSWRTRP